MAIRLNPINMTDSEVFEAYNFYSTLTSLSVDDEHYLTMIEEQMEMRGLYDEDNYE
jgi:hypothetical protein